MVVVAVGMEEVRNNPSSRYYRMSNLLYFCFPLFPSLRRRSAAFSIRLAGGTGPALQDPGTGVLPHVSEGNSREPARHE